MSKLYNTQKDITSNFEIFLLNSVPNIRKTQLNIIPSILFGIIQAESIASSDIAKNLKDNFLDVKLDSVIKRINRFFRNKLFDPYTFYKQIISYAISTYKKKHSDKRVHIIFDHMFSHENYTTLMFTMSIISMTKKVTLSEKLQVIYFIINIVLLFILIYLLQNKNLNVML